MKISAIAVIFTGCSIPPDWSVCECQWLDNRWFHHVTMLHTYTGDQFLPNMLTPGTRLHSWIMAQECPDQGKSYSFDPAGVMKLSHEAWRPENRELIKNICPVGNMVLHFWCAHQYLLKAGSIREENMQLLRGWYAHMRALQLWLDQEEIVKCLPRSSFPFSESSVGDVVAWTYRSIGNSSLREEPKLLVNTVTGLIHVPSFTYTNKIRHSRRNVAPKNKVCIPLADVSCWPLAAVWQSDSCSLCCDPNAGPFGNPSCFNGRRDGNGVLLTYERCCQQDFKFVKCEEIRKSTPGCIDCPQSLSFYCDEAHKFDTVKAWQHMNETYHEYLEEVNKSKAYTVEVEGNQSLVIQRARIYTDFLQDIHRNETAMFSRMNGAESIVNAENQTLEWLNAVMGPIDKNFTRSKRDFDDVSNQFKSANRTLFESRKKEQEERIRKPWLIQRIANNSLELRSVEANLAVVNYADLYKKGNSTMEELAEIDSRINDLNDSINAIQDDIGEIDLRIAVKENGTGLSTLRAAIESERLKLAKIKSEIDSILDKKRACEDHESNVRKITTLNTEFDAIRSQVEILERNLNRLWTEFESQKIFRETAEWRTMAQDCWTDFASNVDPLRNDLQSCSKDEYRIHELTEMMGNLPSGFLPPSVAEIRGLKELASRSPIYLDELSQLEARIANLTSFNRRIDRWELALRILGLWGEQILTKVSWMDRMVLKFVPAISWLPERLQTIVAIFELYRESSEALVMMPRRQSLSPLRSQIKLRKFDVARSEKAVTRLKQLETYWRNALIQREIRALTNQMVERKINSSNEILQMQFTLSQRKVQTPPRLIERSEILTVEEEIERIQNRMKAVPDEVRSLTETIKQLHRQCRSFRERDLVNAWKRFNESERELGLLVESSTNVNIDSELSALLDTRNQSVISRDSLVANLSDLNSVRKQTETKLREINDLRINLMKHEESLRKRKEELLKESPLLELELALKDEAIRNITEKQANAVNKMTEISPVVEEREVVYLEWNATKSALQAEIDTTKHRRDEPKIDHRGVFVNLTSFNLLNATYANLSFAQESLENTTKRISELVAEFKQAETTYHTKERELTEYTEQVARGLIKKVEFVFEY